MFDIEVDAADPQQFIDTVKRISPTFGGINLEDIKAPECFDIERALMDQLQIPVFHDDQHGTAIVVAAGLLKSSSSMHGGQETTLISMMLPLMHHGMLILGSPYTEPALVSTQTGGTPYGVTHVAGMNNDNPLSSDELTLAQHLGARLARVAKCLHDQK